MRRAALAVSLAFALPACVPQDGGSDQDPFVVGEDGGGGVGDMVVGPASDGGPAGEDGGPPEWDAGGGSDMAPDMASPPSGDGLELVEYDDVEIDAGYSEMLTLDLPEDVQSITIVGIGDPAVFYGVVHLEGPEGQILVAENPPGVTITAFDRQLSPFPGAFKSPNRSATAATGVATLLAPNNPEVAVGPGEWRFQLAALGQIGPTTTAMDVLVYIKRAPAVPERGVLDVHMHFSGSRGWTADNAPDDADFQVALNRLREFYAAVGIEIGEVTYDDIPERFRSVDTGPQGPGAAALQSTLHEMFALSAYETGLSFFFVDRIGQPMNGGAIGGIAGGTPGPMLQPGTVRSGVAVATALDPNPLSIGHVMGHEGGHFLGLYHTQEFFGGITDQIPDTPEGFGGADNLMFPTVTPEPAHLTAGQGFVMHMNAAVVPEAPQAQAQEAAR